MLVMNILHLVLIFFCIRISRDIFDVPTRLQVINAYCPEVYIILTVAKQPFTDNKSYQ